MNRDAPSYELPLAVAGPRFITNPSNLCYDFSVVAVLAQTTSNNATLGLPMQSSIFVVNDQPYCSVEVDHRQRNVEFLSNFDENSIDYSLRIHEASEDEQRAAMALRQKYHHALETFFSLIGAYLQAPDCVYAWLSKCSNSSLYELVRRINKNEDVFSKLTIPTVSWHELANSIFRCYESGTDKQTRTVDLYSRSWRRLAGEFLDRDRIDEYNSIKHGFRVSSGGFSLAIGEEPSIGVTPEKMHSLGGSEFGTSFFRISTCEPNGNRCVTSRRISLNWKVEKVHGLLHLLSMSIKNVITALKIANRCSPAECTFHRFEEDNSFELPWSFSPGVTRCNFDRVIHVDQIPVLRKSDLEKSIQNHKASQRTTKPNSS